MYSVKQKSVPILYRDAPHSTELYSTLRRGTKHNIITQPTLSPPSRTGQASGRLCRQPEASLTVDRKSVV